MEGFCTNTLAACATARDSAQLANNTFTEFDRMSEKQTQETSQEVLRYRDQINTLKAAKNAALAAVSQPLTGIVFLPLVWGPWKITAQAKESDIRDSYAGQVQDVQNKLRALEQDLFALHKSSGNTWTWTKFCNTLSVNLSSVYSLLGTIRNIVHVNTKPYQAFAATQWRQIRREISDIKGMIYASRPAGLDLTQCFKHSSI